MPPNNHVGGSSPSRSFFKIPFFHNKRSRLDQHEMETSAKSAAVSKSFSIKSLLGLNSKPSKKEAVASHPNINEAATSSSAKDQQSTQTVPKLKHMRLEFLERSSNLDYSSLETKWPHSDLNSFKRKTGPDSVFKLPIIPEEASSALNPGLLELLMKELFLQSAVQQTAGLQREQTVVNMEQIEESECSSITSEEASSALHPDLLELLMKELFLQLVVQSLIQQIANYGVKLPPGLSRTGRQIVVTGSVDDQVLVQNFYNSQESLASSSSNLSNSSFGVLNFTNGDNGYDNFLNNNRMPPNAVNSNDNQHAYYANQYPQYNFQQANPFMNQFQDPQQFPRFNEWNSTDNISLTSVSSSTRSLYGDSRQNISSTSHLAPTIQNYPRQQANPPCGKTDSSSLHNYIQTDHEHLTSKQAKENKKLNNKMDGKITA